MYIDFIPLKNFTPLWYHIILVVTLITFMQTQSKILSSSNLKEYMRSMGGVLLVFSLIYIGFRPVSGRYFADMALYNKWFSDYARGAPITKTSDLFFHNFMRLSAQIMTNHMFFFTCAFAYIFPLYIV